MMEDAEGPVEQVEHAEIFNIGLLPSLKKPSHRKCQLLRGDPPASGKTTAKKTYIIDLPTCVRHVENIKK